jgi:hemerythrin-like domain-containing protein
MVDDATRADDVARSGAGAPPRGRMTIVFLIHEAFRRDLVRLSTAARTPEVGPERADRLARHWAFVDEQLHDHHHVEDASLWPLLRPKLEGRPDQAAVLDDMEAQHHRLEPMTEAVSAGFASWRRRPETAAGEELAGRLEALHTTLGTHLDDEQSRAFPIVEEALSLEEFEAFGKATAKAVGMRGSAAFFPWIFDGADPIERAAVLSMPPPPVRLLSRYVWEPRYERRVAPLWRD